MIYNILSVAVVDPDPSPILSRVQGGFAPTRLPIDTLYGLARSLNLTLHAKNP